MKLIEVSMTIMFYLAVVSGRRLYESNFEDEERYKDLEKPLRRHIIPSLKSHNLYSNHHDYYDYGRHELNKDSYSLQDELYSNILQQRDEISSYVQRSQPTTSQPQIMYMPVFYPVSQNSLRPIKEDDITKISFPIRWSGVGMVDKNQIWGIVSDESKSSDEGTRPISLDPVEPNEPTVRAPPVEHGSSQAGMTTPAPHSKRPGQCKAAILVCCQRKTRRERQQCFSKYGCTKTYSNHRVCEPKIIDLVINEFVDSYAPL